MKLQQAGMVSPLFSVFLRALLEQIWQLHLLICASPYQCALRQISLTLARSRSVCLFVHAPDISLPARLLLTTMYIFCCGQQTGLASNWSLKVKTMLGACSVLEQGSVFRIKCWRFSKICLHSHCSTIPTRIPKVHRAWPTFSIVLKHFCVIVTKIHKIAASLFESKHESGPLIDGPQTRFPTDYPSISISKMSSRPHSILVVFVADYRGNRAL